ncbi:PH domain-containing protein [Streptomyces sp. SL13]|uniref:PH domain-containing protein n=1 Tax=Streptantibioticus silvisoli TaxID=2705255 RepID=A0AA90K8J7_9ACTN|nr:PH domain-containing protein [Streptantibioticus silvisoli]MDI5967361.1 PH domain-containing protein [Streptantibioticus silvisoli]MDI5970138.1 PH domain-containing protein [Streptantibioticus silvisoli]
MTSPTPSPQPPEQSAYADRAFRSPMGVFGGVLLLIFGVWLVTDAALHGPGRTPWVALSGMLLAAPLVIAFTVRPVVYVSDKRMLVRNPFRTVTIPLARVESVEAKYSTEVFAGGKKYQLWAVPVSMRARKRADRRSTRTMVPDGPPGLFGRTRVRHVTPAAEPVLASSDQAVIALRDLVELHSAAPQAQGEITQRWAWPVYVPAALGLIALIVVNTV